MRFVPHALEYADEAIYRRDKPFRILAGEAAEHARTETKAHFKRVQDAGGYTGLGKCILGFHVF